MKLSKLKLSKEQKKELQSFRNGYGKTWKKQLERFYNNQTAPLDELYVNDKNTLMSTKNIILPILPQLIIENNNPKD